MHQPRKWWIGLPVLAGLVYVASQSLTPRIEADLAARVAARLAIDPAAVSVSGRDARIAGVAPAALAALRDEAGLRKVAAVGAAEAPASAPNASAAVPKPAEPAEPYVFSATLGESVVALDGKLPDETLRAKVVALAAAAGAGRAVTDVAKVDARAPSGDYAGALAAVFEALAALERGKATLSGARLAIEGKGRANVRAQTLAPQIRARLPQGFDLDRLEISPGPVSPYVFEAMRRGAVVTLSGFVPDATTRSRLVDALRRRAFDATIEDRLDIAEGAPAKFTEAAEAGLAALARLDEGRFAVSDSALALSGAARYEGARGEIDAALDDRAPKSFRKDVRLVAHTLGAPLDGPGCRAALAALSRAPLAFENDDSAVSDSSAALMDALTATVLRCQGVAIEVAGFWDDRGIAELARDRSKRRAGLVVDSFVKAGAESSRLRAMGYGPERPVAPNDSEENRARNRRVEFIVK